MSETQLIKSDAANGEQQTGFKAWLSGFFRGDGWMNILTGIGTRNRDKRMYTHVAPRPRLSRSQLEGWFTQDDLTSTIVQLPAREMTRKWITLNVPIRAKEDDSDAATGVMNHLDQLGMRTSIKEAICWARLFGGSVILLGVDDGSEDMSKPLNESSISTFEWVQVLDRWDIQVESYYADPSNKKYGEPETYRIVQSISEGAVSSSRPSSQSQSRVGQVWHESRLLRFDGSLTTRRRKQENSGWSESVIERMRDVISDFNGAFASVANLVQDFAQAVFKIRGLAEMLLHDQDDLVLKRLQIMDMSRSVGRAVPLDADGEDFERKQTPVGGLSDLVDRMMMRVSSASRMPVTLLFGRSPAGMDATGESDIRLFYDNISADQEDSMRSPLERVIHLVFVAKQGPTKGVEPDHWAMEFNALWQESSKEKAETRKIIADTDRTYVDMGAVEPIEVRKSRWGGDAYNPEMAIIEVDGDEGGETLATVNELSLTIERAARVGDIEMVNGARRALAKRLGVSELRDVTTEELGATLQLLRARAAEGEAAGRSDNPYSIQRRGDKYVVVKDADGKVMGTHDSRAAALRQLAALEIAEANRNDSIVSFVNAGGRHLAPNYRMAPEVVSRVEPMTTTELESAPFSLCDNCGFERDGVCVLYGFTVEPDHVCDAWVAPAEVELIAIGEAPKFNANKFGAPDVVEDSDLGKA